MALLIRGSQPRVYSGTNSIDNGIHDNKSKRRRWMVVGELCKDGLVVVRDGWKSAHCVVVIIIKLGGHDIKGRCSQWM